MATIRAKLIVLSGLFVLCGWLPCARAANILFDASKQEVSGNADWVIDADIWDLYLEHYPCDEYGNEANAQFIPTPDQSVISSETDWTGGISAWGYDLVQADHTVFTLPAGQVITYGQAGQYDLSNFDLFIMPEPQMLLSTAEKTALLDYIQAGGSLFMVADHQTSDRNCSGYDSPHIFNDLMGVVISAGVITDYGLFGLVFNVEEISGLNGTDYWFTDAIDDNVSQDPLDPIIFGPFGDGSGGLGLFGSTSMTLDTSTNPTVQGHIWKTDAGGQSTTRVTFATARYGAGRVAAIGDSSPADDGTGDSGDTLYDGWDKASGGVANDIIHLNACHWLITADDTTAPVITIGPSSGPQDCTATIYWETDELATSTVEYGLTDTYGNSESVTGYHSNHSVILIGLTPDTQYHYRVLSDDPAQNGPTYSNDMVFTTTVGTNPTIISGPSVQHVSGSGATVVWVTNEAADSQVEYGLSTSYGSSASSTTYVSEHSLVLSGLDPETTYHFRAGSTDNCGNGPVWSDDQVFSTGSADFDISAWTIDQYDSAASYSFPANTSLAAGSYAVVARNADQAAFEAFWGVSLGSNVLFLNSNEDGSCLGTNGCLPLINGGESYELYDASETLVDGPTIAGSESYSYQRIAADLPAGQSGSWLAQSASLASPGSGMPIPTGIGVVLSEWSDALGSGNYIYEFVELYNDNASSVPDSIPPDPVSDLVAVPVSSDTIRLSFTAVGDDGSVGTASSYDIRYAFSPIRNEPQFAAAILVSGEPAPLAAGNTEIINISGLAENTTYFFALRVGDEQPNWSSISNSSGAATGLPGGSPATDHLVISEIQTRGVSNHNDEFIELYNPTTDPISIDGMSIQKKTEDNGSFEKFDLPSDTIQPHGYFLIATSVYAGAVTADTINTGFVMSYHYGNVALVANTDTLTGCTDPDVIDMVGFGTGNCAETSPAPGEHGAGSTIERAPGETEPGCANGTDTDNNGADFALRTPAEPQNSTMTEAPCSTVLSDVGNTLFLTGQSLTWSSALGATQYKIRRSSLVNFMELEPVPSDVYLLTMTGSTSITDTDPLPGGTTIFYYHINSSDGTFEFGEN
ncbi:lamin tail domain-containing protein [bacterium]|nr:lamin tail domain-containing protein [bacterium]